MNHPQEITELLDHACTALARQMGKQAVMRTHPATAQAPHPALAFRLKGARTEHIYAVTAVPATDAASIARLIRDWNPDEGRLALAPYFPPEQARRLKDAGIPFLDAAGNAHLAGSGVFVLIVGCPPPPDLQLAAPRRLPRLFNPTGVKVLFVLLARPDFANRPYRDLARAADVALGTVGWVMADLKNLGYLLDQGKAGKRLVQWGKLVDEWTGAYARQLLPRLQVRRFRAADPDWWQTADLRATDALWGGDVAADRLTGYLKPGEITIYAKGLPTPLMQAQRMRADPHGNVVVAEKFWNFPPTDAEADTVPPLLVYADLMATGDARAIETARLIHERHLARPD